MSEQPTQPHTSVSDSDLKLKAIVISAIGLAVLLVVTAALMWPFALGLRTLVQSTDPAPPALPEARQQPLPPEPRLQADPEEEMRQLRHLEEAVLSEWRWLDPQETVARVPIDRALEIVAESGLPAAWEPGADNGEPE